MTQRTRKESMQKVYLAKDGRTYTRSTIESADCWIDVEGNVGSHSSPDGYFPAKAIDIGERVILAQDETIRRMPKGEWIKVCSEPTPGVAIVAEWPRVSVIALIRVHGAEEAGPGSTRHGFGLASWDGDAWRFIETTDAPGTKEGD